MATWTDWLGQHESTNLQRHVPSSVEEVVGVVRSQRRLRAVGDRHADNRMGRPEDGTAFLDLKRIDDLRRVPGSEGEDGSVVYRVGAGLRIRELNDRLWRAGFGLRNMGSFDGQHFAAAVCTGTHGSGAGLGAVADGIRSVDLVDGTGQVLRIEDPARPLTVPSKFRHAHLGWRLVQDDEDLWRSSVVSLGAMGVVVGMAVEVIPAYKLWERRSATTWEAIAARGMDAELALRHYEVLINPHPSADGTHFAVETRRGVATVPVDAERVPDPSNDPDELPESSRHVQHELQRLLRRTGVTLLPLGSWLVNHPDDAGNLLTKGMATLASGKVFVDRSDRILVLGSGARAHGFEIAVPLERVNDAVRLVLDQAADWNRAGDAKGDRSLLTSPFSLRFVKGSPHHLAPSAREVAGGGVCDTWCFLEVPRLQIHDEGEKEREFPHYPHAVVRSVWLAGEHLGMRAHWGQHNMLTRSDVERLYPRLPAWKQAVAARDPDGRFATAWLERVGLR